MPPSPATPPATTLRARVRAELVTEIKAEARRQLAVDGAPGLSLRAVTRALGMASSGIYRYFPSRDELLTALIIDAYDALGEAAEAADAGCRDRDVTARWMAVGRAVRTWGLERPNEWALLYGSPVPGYRAPDDTVGPASRVTLVLVGIVVDAARTGSLDPAVADRPGPSDPEVAAEIDRLVAEAFTGVPPAVVLRSMAAWTQLFGMVSFELFGHFHSVVERTGPFFDAQLADLAERVGLPVGQGTSFGTGPDPDSGSGSPSGSDPDDDAPEFYLI